MYLNGEFTNDIRTTTKINSHPTNLPEPFEDNNDMTQILTYALPLSCLAILTVFIFILAIRRRHHVLEKWNSLTRMKNTNPRFYERTGLRRDSEYESPEESCVTMTTVNEEEITSKESDYRVSTIA